jgi:hypothetical protein
MHGRTIIIKKVGLDPTGAAVRIQRSFRRARGLTFNKEDDDTGLDPVTGKPLLEMNDSSFPRLQRLRARIWYLFEDPTSSLAAQIVGALIMLTIFFSIACFVLETDPMMQRRVTRQQWWYLDMVCTAVFSVEYLLRISACTVFKASRHHKVATVAQFVLASSNMIDLLAIMPFFLDLLIRSTGGSRSSSAALRLLRILRLMRLLRIVKLGKRFEGLQLMMVAILQSVTALTLLIFLLTMGITVSASMVYFAEKMHCKDLRGEDPAKVAAYTADCRLFYSGGVPLDPLTGMVTIDRLGYHTDFGICCEDDGQGALVSSEFPGITDAMWWAIVTVATVGYGDVIPRTALGKLVGVMSMIVGILIIALPVAIVGSKFQEAYESSHARQGQTQRNPVLDDVETPEVCKKKAMAAYRLLMRSDECTKEIVESTKIKRQLTYHMYNEFLQLVEHSPLVHEMNKKLELLSPKDPGRRFSSWARPRASNSSEGSHRVGHQVPERMPERADLVSDPVTELLTPESPARPPPVVRVFPDPTPVVELDNGG